MELLLTRDVFDTVCTEGELKVNGQHECFTLELANRDGTPGSCIPQGTYSVVLQPSPKFQASTDPWVMQFAGQMPHIMDIPGRSLIMIHWGNNPGNTEGCVLVGKIRGVDVVNSSRAAFEELFPKIKTAVNGEGCSITVVGGATVGG
jgi:hypothetical protein